MLFQDTYNIIKALEKRGTAYITVTVKRFYPHVNTNTLLDWNVGPATFGDHAVALVGYSVSNNIFYIKDSLYPSLLEIKPQNLILSLPSALVLVERTSYRIEHPAFLTKNFLLKIQFKQNYELFMNF